MANDSGGQHEQHFVVWQVEPDEIGDLNRIDMSYSSTEGFAYRLQVEPGRIGFTLTRRTLDPQFSREYDWDWRELEDFAEHVRAGDVFAAGGPDRRPLGLIELRRSEWNNAAWIQSLYVDRAHRGRGVGSLLIQTGVRRAAELGVRALFVETQTSNAPAVAFYQKHGFRLCGINDCYYSNRDVEQDEVALFLVREIVPD